MSYDPQQIANFQTGLDLSRQPWLIPDDAQTDMSDCYVYRGVINKRDGYDYYATGVLGGNPYCESRMVRSGSGSMTGAIDGVNKVYTTTLSPTPVRRGTVVVTTSAGPQVATDDGVGGFAGDIDGGGTNSVDYDTGAVTVTFAVAPAAGTVTFTYDYHPGLPVMMVANYITSSDTTQLILCDTKYANIYTAIQDRLNDITNRVYTGDETNFFSSVNYPNTRGAQRLLFVNNKDIIQSYDGTSIEDFYAVISSIAITAEAYNTGNGTAGPYTHTTANQVVVRGTVRITDGAQVVKDDSYGVLTGDGTGTIDYVTGDCSVTFNAVVAIATPITIDYSYIDTKIDTCLLLFDFKDRLIALRTTEGGTVFPQRIRISGTGLQGDNFDSATATGAGVIDIPDGGFIMGAAFNRDDLVIFMQKNTWILRYTSNDIVPFSLDKIDPTRGSLAPFSPITYLNVTNAYSPNGFIATDGYSLQRTDNKVPQFSYEYIDQDRFGQCFSGEVPEDRDHYLIHPSPGQTISDRILVTNYEEQTYQLYNIPLSCMGSFEESFDITWNDLTAPKFPSWAAFGAYFGSWDNIGFNKGIPIPIGGGHKGEVWRLNSNESSDNPQIIRNITVVSSSPEVRIQVTSDWNNYAEGDTIFFTGVGGMTEINSKQGYIPDSGITDNYTFDVIFGENDVSSVSAFTDGGVCARVIPMSMSTKQFNPYINQNQKVRMGWAYLYMSTTGTFLTDIDDNPVDCKVRVDVIVDDNETPTTHTFIQIPYKANASNLTDEWGTKKWYKVFVNQTGKFIQLRFSNTQAGSRVRIHAMTLGMMPVGRII